MSKPSTDILNEAKSSLKRIQDFNPNQLNRSDSLGKKFSFEDAIPPTKRIISLFKKVPLDILDDLPDNHINIIKKHTDGFYNILNNIIDFDIESNEPGPERDKIINNIENYYTGLFNEIFHYISYAISKTADFNALEQDGRAAIQAVNDKAESLTQGLEEHENKAQEILEKVRKTAAEQGVSQQAHYFKTEHENHDKQAEIWKRNTLIMACIMCLYGILTIFMHKIPFISPENIYESIQLSISKIIIFFVIGYLLSISAKNFLSHKHNSGQPPISDPEIS